MTRRKQIMRGSVNEAKSCLLIKPKTVRDATHQDRRSIYVLSVLWLTLCSTLVWKHPELLSVFLAFCASWLVAGALSLQENVSTAAPNIKTAVCLAACVVQSSVNAYYAVSVAAGYLAFDHWFSAMFSVDKTVVQVTEDALTLTAFSVVLVVWTINDGASSVGMSRTLPSIWTAYKVLRCWNTVPLQDDPEVVGSGRFCALSNVQKIPGTVASPERATNDFDCLIESDEGRNNLWTIDGVLYDLSDYIHSHPGGKEAILLGRGREDCTALFQSYHPFTSAIAHQVLRKYKLPSCSPYFIEKKKKDASTPPCTTLDDPFYQLLVQGVEQRLKEIDFDPIQDRAATTCRTVYYATILAAVLASGVIHCRGSIVGSFLLAISGWLLGALGHDAGHFAASRRATVNEWAVWGMWFVCNPIVWQHQHTFAHHSHTNSIEDDPDLHHFETFLRVHRRFKQNNSYRNQSNWLFVLFSYTFVVFGTCFWIPLGMIREGSLYGIVEWTDRKRPLRTAGLFLHLFVYSGTILALPFFVHNNVMSALCAVVAHVATSGVIFALFSQINHLNEASLDSDELHKRQLTRDPMLISSWAVKQIETSNNFCPCSSMWHILSNGLNLQIEHHLFPGLNHCHLSLIQPVVQSICEQHGVCYKSYGSWSEIMQATLDWLDRLSIEPQLGSNKID